MFASLPLPILVGAFVVAAAVVWGAGIRLSSSTDVLARNLGFGEALGGLIFLAIATNLPEIAITATAAISKQLDVATGNILGGIAVQTVVLVLLDGIGVGKPSALTSRVTSLVPAIEGVLVMGILVLVVMGAQVPPHERLGPVEPLAVVIALFWVIGIWCLARARKGLPWTLPDGAKTPADGGGQKQEPDRMGTGKAALLFLVSAAATLVGGVILERSGDAVAGRIGMSGALFAATVLAAATSLPEISTGLAAVAIGDYQLAVSDIFGGNAFLPVLFLEAGLISGAAVLPQAKPADLYLAGLGAILTGIYIIGLVVRPGKQLLRLGVDSLLVLTLYVVGIAGLLAVLHR